MEHDTVRPLFAINRFGYEVFSFVRWDSRLGNVDWSYSAWDSAASSLVRVSGLLAKLSFLNTIIDTRFNSMLLADCSS